MIFLRLKRENQLGGDTRRLKYPRKTLFQKLELRRRRLLLCSLVRSQRLHHSVNLPFLRGWEDEDPSLHRGCKVSYQMDL